MFYAKDEHGVYILASEKNVYQHGYCPHCNVELITKCSSRGRYFFVHPRKCTKVGGESDAHVFWKEYVFQQLKSCGAKQEVMIGNQRRADLLVGKTVIEIQFSNISAQSIKRRIDDYVLSGFDQYWIFKLPQKANRHLILTPMMMYIWKETSFPLLYIDFTTKQLCFVKAIQMISKNGAMYIAEHIGWQSLLFLKRVNEPTAMHVLQQKWLYVQKQHRMLFYQTQIYYRSSIAKELYYLQQLGYTIDQFGIAYTGNSVFTVVPFIWQIHLIYIRTIKQYTLDMCCLEMRKMMIVIDAPMLYQLVVQVLERFSVQLDDM